MGAGGCGMAARGLRAGSRWAGGAGGHVDVPLNSALPCSFNRSAVGCWVVPSSPPEEDMGRVCVCVCVVLCVYV